MQMRKLMLTLSVMLLVMFTATAQDKTISGKVTNDKNAPVEGVSITSLDGKYGTQTDKEGNYRLTIPSSIKTVLFTYVNYQTVQRNITGNTIYNVLLQSTNKNLDEVIVVAYGSQKKEAITGAVSKIGAEQLEQRLTTNISQALAGAAPGIAATTGNGQPGSAAALRIRGFGSINASSAPLYVVDGFPYGGDISDINTNDIESITLLKDASSTALYGARAANGVVVVTTKKGRSPKPEIRLFANYGLSSRGIQEYETVGTFDYYPLMWQSIKNNLMYPVSGPAQTEAVASANASNTVATQLVYNPFDVPNNQVVGVDGKMNPSAQLRYNDFDWFNGLERIGPRKEVGFSVSSKANKSDYTFSLNYLKDEGFVIRSDFQRVNGRIAVNSQINDWLKAGVNVTANFVNSNQAAGDGANTFINPFVFARGIAPIYPVRAYTTAGAPVIDALTGNQWYDWGLHPGAVNRPTGASPGRHILYESLLNETIQKRNSIIARTNLEIKLAPGLTYTPNVGIDIVNQRNNTFQNKIVGDGVTSGGFASVTSNEFRTFSVNNLLNYTKRFGKHEITALVGHEIQKTDDQFFTASRRQQNIEGNTELSNFVVLNGATGSVDKLRREAYLSRLNYGYSKKYFLDLSFRRDASSRFAPESKWGNFYSVGASWIINKEKFLQNTSWIDNLKLRASYGIVGNDELAGYFRYQALYGFGFNNATEPGSLASQYATRPLTWEENKTTNVGIEFGFLNRISGTVEFFDRGSSQLLFDVPLGLSSVITTITQNIGSMSNKGVEAQLNVDVIKKKNFVWDVQFNVTSLKNKITKLPNSLPITQGTKRLEEGKDLFAFYLRRWYGVDPADGAGLYYATPGTALANVRVTSKGDTVTTNPNFAALGYAGSSIPKFFGSFTNTFSYKNFSLSFLFNYQVGGKFYDGNYAGLMAVTYGRTLHVDNLGAWKKPGDIATVPRLDISQTNTNFNAQSDRWLIDASYLNVRNVTLTYKLPNAAAEKMGLSQARFFVGGENIHIFSKRKGLNPAESFNGTNSAVYTPNRLINMGINVSF
jgi:TonB-linked SusC/RagA family outer membrane protein